MESASADGIGVEVEAGVATVTVDRPSRRNALSSEAHRTLELLWPELQDRDDVATVVLTGSGGVFGAGGDVIQMLEARRATAGSGISTARARRLVSGLIDLDKPVVAAVEGPAVGLSATLALLCDFLVVADGAWFADPHLALGLVPGDGGAAIWTALVGPHRARAVLLRGARLDADELDGLGLVAQRVPAGSALAAAQAIAGELARAPQPAVRGTTATINAWLRHQLRPMLDVGLAYELVTLRSADFAEGLDAVAERRDPRFTDRWED